MSRRAIDRADVVSGMPVRRPILILLRSVLLAGVALTCCAAAASAVTEYELVDPAGAADDYMGWDVALSGSYAIVGADLNADVAVEAGKALIFHFDGSQWVLEATLYPPAVPNGRFGTAVAISGDYALVGAPNRGLGTEAVYVFKRTGASWAQEAVLVPNDWVQGDGFGGSVALDGSYALVGARNDDTFGTDAGAAYMFSRSGVQWTQQAQLPSFDAEPNGHAGQAVDIDGSRAVSTETGSATMELGYAYPFRLNGSSWNDDGKVTGADQGLAVQNYFGSAVALSGLRLLVGAYLHTHSSYKGSAYVFDYSPTGGSWSQTAELLGTQGSLEWFGDGVALDGAVAAAGAQYGTGEASDSGVVYVFEKVGYQWALATKLMASNGTSQQHFGQSVSLSSGCVAVGAPGDTKHGAYSGTAYVYCDLPTPITKLVIDIICCWIPPDYTTGPVELEIRFVNLDPVLDQQVVWWIELVHPDGTREELVASQAIELPVGSAVLQQVDLAMPDLSEPGEYAIVTHWSDDAGGHAQLQSIEFAIAEAVPLLPGGGALVLAALLLAGGAAAGGRIAIRDA
jgi:hypothetical protein